MNHVKKNADDYQQQTNKQLYTSHNNQHPNNFGNFLSSVSPGLDGGIMYIKNYTNIYITCKSSIVRWASASPTLFPLENP